MILGAIHYYLYAQRLQQWLQCKKYTGLYFSFEIWFPKYIYIYIFIFLHIHTALLITLNIYITKEKHSFPSIIPFSGGSLVPYVLALTLIKILMKCWDGLLGPNSLLDFPDISQFLASLVFQYYRFVHLVRTTALSHTLI